MRPEGQILGHRAVSSPPDQITISCSSRWVCEHWSVCLPSNVSPELLWGLTLKVFAEGRNSSRTWGKIGTLDLCPLVVTVTCCLGSCDP